MATKICPYCRSPVEPSQSSEECPSCGTPHHGDCWKENGGCAVVGCGSGPATGSAGVVLPPIEEPSGPVVVEVDEGSGGDGKRSRTLVAVVAGLAVLAMVGVGVGVAVLLHAASKGEGIEVGEAATTLPQSQPSPARRNVAGRPSGPSGFSEAEVIAGAEHVLRRHHELLGKADGDPNSRYAHQAFALLSARKQRKEAEDGAAEGQGGFEYWISKREYENLSIGSEVCLPGYVDLRSPGYWNPRDGEAMVYVDYGSYAGFTWVLYEGGHWTYDAGYGHVPSREARWAPQEEILFRSTGHGC